MNDKILLVAGVVLFVCYWIGTVAGMIYKKIIEKRGKPKDD